MKYISASLLYILVNLNQVYVLTCSSMTGLISWECLDCSQCVSKKWTCLFVPYSPSTTLEVFVSRFVPKKRWVHIYTLCGECCDGISEDDQIALIMKGFRSRAAKSLPWKRRTWELCYSNAECQQSWTVRMFNSTCSVRLISRTRVQANEPVYATKTSLAQWGPFTCGILKCGLRGTISE